MSTKHFLHLRAPGNWSNDPNGFIYFKGYYHLFYQYFPYGPQWGTMHWGHAVSTDLVHWQHKGIALFPTKEYDKNGCFSGSALNIDDTLYLYYTGVKYKCADEENIHVPKNNEFFSAQAMITSDDGFTFDNFNGKKEIIPQINDLSVGHPSHTRDPKVWKSDDTYYMVLGTQVKDSEDTYKGRLLFYTSTDAVNWSLGGTFDGQIGGYMWECPDLFTCGTDDVLVVSPMGYFKDGLNCPDQAVCVTGAFDEKNCRLKINDNARPVDYGTDFYAPQTTTDKDGRRIIIGWMRMPEVVSDGDTQWIGMMCSPRIVQVIDGHIYFKMHPETKHAISRSVSYKQLHDNCLSAGYNKPFRIRLAVKNDSQINIGGYKIYLKDNCLYTDRTAVYPGENNPRLVVHTPPLADKCDLDIIVDGHLIEIFINDGYVVLSQIVYNLNGAVAIESPASEPEFMM